MDTLGKIRAEIERLIEMNKTKRGFPAGTICAVRIEAYEKLLSFLDTLEEESDNWKPSEGQMSMLLAVINDPNNAGSESCHLALKSIYEQLKKL